MGFLSKDAFSAFKKVEPAAPASSTPPPDGEPVACKLPASPTGVAGSEFLGHDVAPWTEGISWDTWMASLTREHIIDPALIPAYEAKLERERTEATMKTTRKKKK